jgi:hypothetical protein
MSLSPLKGGSSPRISALAKDGDFSREMKRSQKSVANYKDLTQLIKRTLPYLTMVFGDTSKKWLISDLEVALWKIADVAGTCERFQFWGVNQLILSDTQKTSTLDASILVS